MSFGSIYKKLTKTQKDIFSLLSASIFYKFAGYLIIVLLARYLGKETLGEYFFAISFVGIFIILSELGINTVITRTISRDKSKTLLYMCNVMGLRLLLCLACFAVINIAAWFIQRELFVAILLVSIFMLLESLYSSFGSLFLAYKKVKYNIISGISTKILLIFLILLILHYKPNLITILWIHIVASCFMFFLAMSIARKKFGKIAIDFNPSLYKQIIKESLPFALLTFIGIIFYRVDTVMLGFMKTYSEVGTYGAGFKLREALLFIPSSVAMILYPQMAELHRTTTELKKIYSKAIKWIILPSLVSIVVVFPLARPIISIIYGPRFINSAQVLRVLYLTVPLMFFNVITVSLFKAINKENVLVGIVMGSLLVKIPLNLYFIPLFSYVGTAITTIITDVLQFGLLSYYIYNYLRPFH